jgi:alanine dehydrogenase
VTPDRPPLLVLSQAEVRSLLDLDGLIDALAGAFVELSEGRASVPPRVMAVVPDRGMLAAMPGFASGVLETKLVSVFPGNQDGELPSHQAVVLVFDPETGSPLALLDGTHITAVRTGAASALATRALARADAGVLAVLGAGVQGRSHLEAVSRVRSFDEIRVASRTPAHAEALATEFGAKAVGSFEEAVRGADVVCACTDAAAPILRLEWLAPGAHVTSVGASRHGPELDPAIVRTGLLVVESRVAFSPYPAGAHELQGLDPDVAVELGEILSGRHPGRTADDQITVYKSMGHAVEDAAAAGLVYRRARADGVGTELDLGH